MANEEHLKIIRRGVDAWNEWRRKNLGLTPDLRGANLSYVDLPGADLSGGKLNGADLCGVDLRGANLSGADLRGAQFIGAMLFETDLRGANLCGAILCGAQLIEADLRGASLAESEIYGAAVWDVKVDDKTNQQNLLITPSWKGAVTVDNIKVAQFIYLLLNNKEIREVIDTVGRKGVLLLGRFTGGRIAVLERLREELRKRDFLPMVFNFDKPEVKDFTETVRLLAGLSHFVIADITNPKSTPLELQATVPEYMIPFVPIIEKGEEPFAMFTDLWIKHREWVLDPIRYPSVDRLIQVLDTEIVRPAQARFADLLVRKAEKLRVRDI
jgi:Pentapeptide repeats (8 copies)